MASTVRCRPSRSLTLGVPAQQLLGQRDVGLADLRIVGRQRLVHDLRPRAGDVDDRLGELEQRELVRVADVDRVVVAGLGEPDQAVDQVGDERERARLRAVAEHRDRLVLQRLAQEGRDGAAVERAHPRAVGVEDPHDGRVDALLAVVGHRQGLGVALGLVVDAARADRVHVAPVALGLRVDLRVAVDLGGRGDQEAGAVQLREPQRVVRAVGADLQRLQRQPQVVDRRRRGGEVVDEVDGLVDEEGLDDVRVDVPELRAADVLDVRERAGLEVVDADDAIASRQQLVADMRSEEAGPAGDETGGHAQPSLAAGMTGTSRVR